MTFFPTQFVQLLKGFCHSLGGGHRGVGWCQRQGVFNGALIGQDFIGPFFSSWIKIFNYKLGTYYYYYYCYGEQADVNMSNYVCMVVLSRPVSSVCLSVCLLVYCIVCQLLPLEPGAIYPRTVLHYQDPSGPCISLKTRPPSSHQNQ